MLPSDDAEPMLIDLKKIEPLVQPDVFRRGQMLARLGFVSSLQVRPEKSGDTWVQGSVKDNGTQKPSFRFSDQGATLSSHDCTCPARLIGICQHVVALAAAAANWKPDQETVTAKKNPRKRKVGPFSPPTESLVSELSTEELPIKAKKHFLDGVHLSIKYDQRKDVLELEAWAAYGKIRQPLLDPKSVAEQDEKGNWHMPEREWDVEQDAFQLIVHHVPLKDGENKHQFQVMGPDIYPFVKDDLPELEYRLALEIDPTAQHVMSVSLEEFQSDWRIKQSSGVDWFAFSVEWQCKQNKISLEQLEDMLASGRSYIRAEDGSFIECQNLKDIEEAIELIKRSKEQDDGTFQSKLYLAPELFETVRKIKKHRWETTSEAFEAFLKETRDGKPIEPVVLPPRLDKELRSYQKDGVAWMMFLLKYGFGGILADDMGLGKTAQVLTFLEVIKSRYPGKPALVVCPKTLLLTWQMEAQKFTPDLKVLIVDGLVNERSSKIKSLKEYDVILTSYSILQRDLPVYLKEGIEFSACILDEAQYIKNARSMSAEVVKLVPASFRLALTGTPLENGVHELWSIFDFLMPDFLGDAKRFASKFERPIRERNDRDAIDKLKLKIRPFMLRRIKENLLKDLPPKLEQVSYSELTSEQVLVYTRVLQEVRKEIFQTVQEKGFKRARIEILASLTKLRRICDHPHLVDPLLPKTEELSGKMALTLELVREAVRGQHKILLFSQYTSMLDLLRDHLNEQGIKSCTIEGKTRDRQAQIEEFCSTETPVFLLSLRAGGTGLTLTAADVVILYDPWWNPQVERQAMDRAHRMGQTKTVSVYKMVTKGSIEEKVLELQQKKQQVFDALMSENADLGEALTWEDVQGLLQ